MAHGTYSVHSTIAVYSLIISMALPIELADWYVGFTKENVLTVCIKDQDLMKLVMYQCFTEGTVMFFFRMIPLFMWVVVHNPVIPHQYSVEMAECQQKETPKVSISQSSTFPSCSIRSWMIICSVRTLIIGCPSEF